MRPTTKTRHGPLARLGGLLLGAAALAVVTAGCAIPRGATAGLSPVSPAVTSAQATSGAWIAPVVPPPGWIFTQYQAPLDYRFANQGAGTTVGTRMGTSEASYLRIPLFSPYLSFAWDDASLREAQRSGALQQADYVDYEVLSVLGIYTNVKFHVYGE